jgi:hypothetical protein
MFDVNVILILIALYLDSRYRIHIRVFLFSYNCSVYEYTEQLCIKENITVLYNMPDSMMSQIIGDDEGSPIDFLPCISKYNNARRHYEKMKEIVSLDIFSKRYQANQLITRGI